jgi:peptidyl-prolyl cis-trans isomerase C
VIPTLVKRVLREPLVHFIALGTLLFAGYAVLKPGVEVTSPQQIALTFDELAQLEMLFRAQWRREPTPDEFSALVETKIKQEVLYREALALGLDENDEIVKRRMAQKMQFLAEDVAAAYEPTSRELAAWYAENSDTFAQPSRVSFRHLYFSPDQRGTQAYDDASRALSALTGEPEDSKLADSLGDPFMFQDYYADRTSVSLAKDFGPPFAAAVTGLTPDAWQGPIESGYGWHLVFVDSVVPGRVPSFEEIESDVKTAWLGQRKADAWRKAYEEMRAKYAVLLPMPPDEEAGSASAAEATPAMTSAPDGEAPR